MFVILIHISQSIGSKYMISSLMIRDKIRVDYITSGRCGPGDKLPTIRDIAK